MKALEKQNLKQKLRIFNERYVYLLDIFRIPSSKSDDGTKCVSEEKTTEHEARLNVMQNKINSKNLQRKRRQNGVRKLNREKPKKACKLKLRFATHGLKIPMKIEAMSKPEKVEHSYNSKEKLLFSKVQFDENDVSKKGIETDTKKLLRRALIEKENLKSLKSKGDAVAYSEVRQKKAWDRAIAKTLGQKLLGHCDSFWQLHACGPEIHRF
ncbi:uncharacterized protein LOC129727300 isoform X2 [Wyeomyia smithii]|uniref:uncharacterized protein LOC129727300 isoform X2 n=1 Tax=Wyeomyia smithii TaxID=174621 RepID=UPI0024680AFE|nr:uncharacterized protein LOC129727300 isoform X2 [Wyeomyia smithii]